MSTNTNTKTMLDTIGKHCKAHRITIVTAESCTGGGIAFELSKSKLASAILERGYVTYSNQSKESLLNVKAETIQLHGAVSKQVAIEMAEGALKNSIAQVSFAITGLAGEDNDAKSNKGTAWVAVSIIDSKTYNIKLSFSGTRLKFVNHVVQKSFEFFIKVITKEFPLTPAK